MLRRADDSGISRIACKKIVQLTKVYKLFFVILKQCATKSTFLTILIDANVKLSEDFMSVNLINNMYYVVAMRHITG